ncbi:helix-turn-helix domain-containing protein [Myxococcota bacterium]
MDSESFQRRVGGNLRKARWLAGLTQEEVAAQYVGDDRVVSYRYYQELERGERNPSLRILQQIAGVLGTTVAALVDVNPRATERARARLAEAPKKPPRRGRRPRR